MIKFFDYLQNRLNKESINKNKFWDGYEDFKIGVILKQARLESGLTQEEIAKKLNTNKSVISRIENHAEDIKISTLEKFLNALNKEIHISITNKRTA